MLQLKVSLSHASVPDVVHVIVTMEHNNDRVFSEIFHAIKDFALQSEKISQNICIK